MAGIQKFWKKEYLNKQGEDVIFKHFYEEIEDIQRQSASMDIDQLHQELQYYLQLDTWRSLLLYGGLYISKTGTPPVLGFYARKTLESIELACKKIQGNGNGTTTESGEPPTGRIPDRLLISLTILVFSFDNAIRHKITGSIEHSIRKKLSDLNRRFIDKLPLGDYLNILSDKLQKDETTLKSLRTFFDDLIKNAGWGKMELHPFQAQAQHYKEYIKRLILEAGSKLEKPDRIFSYAESMNDVTHLAESLFDSEKLKGKVSFNKSQWDYLCAKPSKRLGLFWVTCMVGLFAFSQSFDRQPVLSQAAPEDKTKVTSTEKPGKDIAVNIKKMSSLETIKNWVGNIGIKPGLKLLPVLK